MQDDPYSFDAAGPSALDDTGLEADEGFQQAVRTSYGNRPTKTAAGLRGARGVGAMRLPTGRQQTAARLGTDMSTEDARRPMTAVKTAGFRGSSFTGANSRLEPAVGFGRDSSQPLEKSEERLEERIKAVELKIHKLLEETAMLCEQRKFQEAQIKAKEAIILDRQLSKLREEDNPETVNQDLSFATQLNQACVFEQAEMFPEALHAYHQIIKHKISERAGRVRVNMGNIYFQQKQYLQAVKMYRMALDQTPNTHLELRNHMLKNIAHSFVQMGQYADAVSSYEHVLDNRPVRELGGVERKVASRDFPTAFNLELCYFALGENDRMRSGFQTLLQQELPSKADDDRYLNLDNDAGFALVLDVIKDDNLRKRELREQQTAHHHLLSAAKLIAPAVDASFAAGYDWCIGAVKQSAYSELAAELEITKAISFLKMRDFKQATQILKGFERRGSQMQSTAAANLSFLYFLEKQFAQADKYADLAMAADRYNPSGLVNKGNCAFVNGEVDRAMELFQEALAVDSTCPEALYNLGLANKELGHVDLALECFEKLYGLLPNSAEVVYQVAHCFELLRDPQAIEWFLTLVSLAPTDPDALAHLGDLYDAEGDKSQAFQYHFEAFRYFPGDLNTLEWLGAYYVESQFPEKAIQYFQRAASVQPSEVRWLLMMASCYRRAGNYPVALDVYKDVHQKFPDNIECLQFLVRITTDMGLSREQQQYVDALQAAQRRAENKRDSSARRRSAASSGRRSAGSRPDAAEPSMRATEPSGEQQPPQRPTVDASYADPIGEQSQRPRTGAVRRAEVDGFSDEELGDDLLPE